MISLDKLVQVGFTVKQATSLALFFRNIGYLTTNTAGLMTDFSLPENKVVVIDSIDTLKVVFKADTEDYALIETILNQKGNMKPNQSKLNNVIVYVGALAEGQNWGNLVDEMISVNANYAQLLVATKDAEEIKNAGAKALANNRLLVAQTDDEDVANKVADNVAQALKALNNANVMLMYKEAPMEFLNAGVASIMAQGYLGAVGSLYSTVTGVTPEDYTATVNANLDEQNVSYYTYVNPINGGGVEQYASPIVVGGYMINGEDAKRRYIRYCIDLMLKAKAVDFLKGKHGYTQESSVLLSAELNSLFVGFQTNELVRNTEIVGDKKVYGFEIKVYSPSEIRELDEEAYNAQKWLVKGYYRDVLTGRAVEIDLFIDPTDAQLNTLGF